jgi:hypothetical protein
LDKELLDKLPKEFVDLLESMPKKLWTHCPLCENRLEPKDGNLFRGIMNGMGVVECKACEYKYAQQGSYATKVTIGKESFWCDDMCDGGERLRKRIKELREKNDH